MSLNKILHYKGLKKRFFIYLINRVFAGTNSRFFEIKRKLLIKCGYEIGRGTKVVGPVYITGKLSVGENCWIGKNLMVNGDGSVRIGNNCDIAPEVSFQTGGHLIGDEDRRAGEGVVFNQSVGSGTWIGARTTILNDTSIGNSCVIAGCSCVVSNIPSNVLVGGVPAKVIRELN